MDRIRVVYWRALAYQSPNDKREKFVTCVHATTDLPYPNCLPLSYIFIPFVFLYMCTRKFSISNTMCPIFRYSLIQTVLFQFQIKRASTDTQQFGSGFPIVASCFQCFQNSCPFCPFIVQRIDFCLFEFVRQVHVFRSDPVVFRQQGGTFHRPFQFPYVPGHGYAFNRFRVSRSKPFTFFSNSRFAMSSMNSANGIISSGHSANSGTYSGNSFRR